MMDSRFEMCFAVDQPAERIVTIPTRDMHEGYHFTRVRLPWYCPVCGGPRGEPFQTFSYDGSRRLAVDGWRNPCGHIDKYADVRKQAADAVQAKTSEETTR